MARASRFDMGGLNGCGLGCCCWAGWSLQRPQRRCRGPWPWPWPGRWCRRRSSAWVGCGVIWFSVKDRGAQVKPPGRLKGHPWGEGPNSHAVGTRRRPGPPELGWPWRTRAACSWPILGSKLVSGSWGGVVICPIVPAGLAASKPLEWSATLMGQGAASGGISW